MPSDCSDPGRSRLAISRHAISIFKRVWLRLGHTHPAETLSLSPLKPSLYSPARFIHLLIQYLDKEGVDSSPVLRAFEAERSLLAHPETLLPPLQALALFRALADLVDRSDIGLQVGKLASYGAMGDAGRAMLSCATLRESLQCCAEFYPLVSPSFTMQVKAQPSYTELRWWPVRPVPFDFLRVAYDMTLGAMDAMLSAVLGERLDGYDAYFTYVAPPHEAAYARLTKARCHFDMPGLPCLRLHIDTDLLATVMPLSDAAGLAILRKRLTQRLALAPMQGLWTAWVSMMLEQAHGEQPSLDLLASIINVSPSTLTRHLKAEGRNFRTLSNEIRHQRACKWLSEGQMMVSEIAERLGYADVPSFVRAFKAISGTSPGRFASSR